mmetsp:Transcript_53498/g.164514  ORF Transcript_53498/g.164514 Transcript_53498/m.164514 type:complete len:226 (-) Transcript_53498:539-1216(-)
MTFSFKCRLMKWYSSKKRCSLGHMTYPCSSVSTVAASPLCLIDTKTGGLQKEMRASCSTRVVCVAEKRNVWRFFGSSETISRTSSSNPLSSTRSASSTARTSRFFVCQSVVSFRWSSSRPGVDTTICWPLPSLYPSVLRLMPPMQQRKVIEPLYRFSSRSRTPSICWHSSRVGPTIIAPVPFLAWNPARVSSSTIGMRNASVLPAPVLASARRSCPFSAAGMHRP